MSTTTDPFDAIVVGSGAGGGPVAWSLSRAGKRVLLLEKGPHYEAADFYHDELEVCRRQMFLPDVTQEPNVLAWGPGPGEPTAKGWIACCVGGGTVLMSGFCFRMHHEDFAVRTRYGEVAGCSVADWPIRFEDLEPFYEEAERVLGVSGGENPFEPRRGPYPLPPILHHGASALIDTACRELGHRVFPIPRAILSAEYDGRSACAYCGFCGSYGCEVDAKSSSAVTFVRQAARTGNLTLRASATVTRVHAEGGRARGVTYVDVLGEHRARAPVVVLAASAIQTARLLLLSGLGNASGQVGRNLLFAGHVSGWGRFPRPHPAWGEGRGLPFIDRALQDFYVLDGALPHPKGGTILFQLPHPNPIYAAERLAGSASPDAPPLFGRALEERMREVFHDTHTIEFEAFNELFPGPGTHVTLDPARRDRLGLPVASIHLEVPAASRAASDYLGERAREVLVRAGATATGLYDEDRVYFYLQAGTARMGSDAKSSVVDASCQAHDVRGLWVADSSSFPSAGGAPFTLTIMANALRVAAAILAG